MSSRWPHGQQDQRSPYASYDGEWQQDDASDQPLQDNGWQSQEQSGYGDQWPSAQGSGRPAGRAAQAVAEPRAPQRQGSSGLGQGSSGRGSDDFQREWDQSGGGFGDDNDLEWISYLTGGRSAAPKPDEAPPERRSGRQERPRSRRGRGRAAGPDPELGANPGGIGPPPISAQFPVQPPAPPAAPEDRAATRGRRRAAPPDPGYGPDTGQTGRPTARRSRHGRAAAAEQDPDTDPGYGRRAPAAPRHDEPAAPRRPAAADSGYQLPTLADTQYGQPPVAADPQYGQPAAPQYGRPAEPQYGQPAAPQYGRPAEPQYGQPADPQYGHPADPQYSQPADPHYGQPADPQYGHAAGTQYGQPAAPAWSPAADTGYDQAALAGWPAVAEPRHDQITEAEPIGWPEPERADAHFDHGSVAGWPSVDSGYDQAALAGWPPVAEPRHDEVAEPTGWPATDSAFAGRAPDDTGFAQSVTAEWLPTVDDEGAGAQAASAPPRKGTARKTAKQAPAKKAPAKKRGTAKAAAKTAAQPQAPRLLADPEPGEQPLKQGRQPKLGRRRTPKKVLAIVGAAAVVAAGAGAVLVFSKSASGPDHSVTTPKALGAYTEQPQLAVQMHAAALRQQIISGSAGEAHNVVYAVYQNGTSSGGSSGPQIILFIGGNLSGTSAGSFISTFTAKLQGAVTTSPGSLGGAAACVPSVDGRVAECVWADNDTFGVVASQTLSPGGLANEMRRMRPLVEHVTSSN